MMNIKCDMEYYNKVIEFSRSIGKYDQLVEQLNYLTTWGCRTGEDTVDFSLAKCELFSDFVFSGQEPTDFTFALYKRAEDGTYRFMFNGGVNFHEATQNWSINT